MVTLFTVPKPFRGHLDVIQRNAIASWRAAVPAGQVLLFGDEPGTAEAAADLGAEHAPDLARTPSGAPRLDDLFRRAHERARHGTLGFVNSDIVFRGNLGVLTHLKPPFLVVGESIDLDLREPIRFADPDWRSKLPAGGRWRGPLALDYFLFSRGLFGEIPPFAVGRARFDNWLVRQALGQGAALVDGTDALGSVHQHHEYAHLAGGRHEAYRGADARRNQSLAGWWCYLHLYSTLDARWTLADDGLRPAGRRFAFLRQLAVRISGLRSEIAKRR